MRNFTNAINVMQNAFAGKDRVNVAGLVELRQGGPERPHLYCTRRSSTAPAGLAGEPGCSPERSQGRHWRAGHMAARPCAIGRSLRFCAPRIS